MSDPVFNLNEGTIVQGDEEMKQNSRKRNGCAGGCPRLKYSKGDLI
jgi:hypothetical protein